jgi:CDP-6-deoxy-D-xylo-4-hexulose-3-dehydrase
MMAKKPRVPLNLPTYGKEEIAAAVSVLRSDRVTMGDRVSRFERAFARKLGVKYAVMVNSGSSANLLAMSALLSPRAGRYQLLRRGAEVLVPALTWSTTIWPIIQLGCRPVLCDVNRDDMCIDLADVERGLSRRTAGVVPVHLLGNGADIKRLKRLVPGKVAVVEDTCESLGTKIDGKYAGTLGLLGTYSFYFSHHITTIEGGRVVTNHRQLYEVLVSQRAHGWTRGLPSEKNWQRRYPKIDPRFLFIDTGYNLRPTEIQGAFGLIQLKKLSSLNRRRSQIAALWARELSGLEWLEIPRARPGVKSSWFGFVVLLPSKKLREKFRLHLEKNGVETRPVVTGNLARHPVFETVNCRKVSKLANANRIMDCGIYWGNSPMLNDGQVDYLVKVVKQFAGKI